MGLSPTSRKLMQEKRVSSGDVIVEPKFDPESVSAYYYSSSDDETLMKKAKKHLAAVGWTFFFYVSDIASSNKELRYRSPSGTLYSSLKTACKACLDEMNHDKSEGFVNTNSTDHGDDDMANSSPDKSEGSVNKNSTDHGDDHMANTSPDKSEWSVNKNSTDHGDDHTANSSPDKSEGSVNKNSTDHGDDHMADTSTDGKDNDGDYTPGLPSLEGLERPTNIDDLFSEAERNLKELIRLYDANRRDDCTPDKSADGFVQPPSIDQLPMNIVHDQKSTTDHHQGLVKEINPSAAPEKQGIEELRRRRGGN